MFEKRLSELTADDIKALVERRAAEGMELEFKQALDDKQGFENARDDLAREIIAFANAYGGTLVVGIAEDGDRRAGSITPLKDCNTLAERLAKAVPDRIEPRIPGFECEGVVTEANGTDGVVVIRVPASVLGPHRFKVTAKSRDGHIYVRRNTESMPTSMQEVHDLVLNQARSGDRQLEMRSKAYDRFDAERARISFPDGNSLMATEASFVAVAVPVARLQVPDLIGRMPVEPHALVFPLEVATDGHTGAAIPVYGRSSWSPRLRGIRTACVDRSMAAALDAGEDGVVTTGFWCAPSDARLRGGTPSVYLAWLLAAAASVLVRLEKARRRASYPDAQYVLTGRLVLRGDWLMALSDAPDGSGRVGMDHLGQVDLPEHLVGGVAGFHEIMLSLERDLVNASGNSFVPGLRIDFNTALRA